MIKNEKGFLLVIIGKPIIEKNPKANNFVKQMSNT